MNKKTIIILLSFFLLFSLVACSSPKVDKKEMKNIDINFNVNSVTNGTMNFNYPSDEWKEIESPLPYIPVMLVPIDAESLDININIVESEDVEMPLEKFLEGLPLIVEKLSPAINVNLAEIRTLNGIDVAYNENTIKFTEENIEKGLKSGVLTEQAIEQSGGKETLLNIPEQKQIQMTFYLDNKDVTITGTYLDDSQKEMVLKAMTTMVQTAKLK